MPRQDVAYWLALKEVPRLPLQKKLALVEKLGLVKLFENPPALSSFGLTANQIAAIVKPDWQKIMAIEEACQQCQCYMLGYGDPLYPTLLKQIYDPPLVLYVQGNVNLLAQEQLAIVGSRSASIHGKEITKQLANELVIQGLVITSGLAIGIDGSAHRAALLAKGKTIAVVATGLDTVYPNRHKALANDILQADGAIISEFPPGTMAKPGHFPKRNRIISGLSLGVLVVEAELKSGSLITARTALEQNRDVFAVPGSIANPYAKGCHWLIKQGAKLVDETADIINELDFSVSPEQLVKQKEKQGTDHTEKTPVIITANNGQDFENNAKQGLFIDPLLASVGTETTPVDQIVSRSKLPVEDVLSRLTLLELRGLVSAVPGGYQRLIKG